LTAQEIESKLESVREALDRDDRATARQTIEEILADQPDCVEAIVFKGRLALVESRYGEALNYFKLALQRDPSYVEGYLLAAEAALSLRELQQAEAFAREAARLNPESAFAHYRVANAAFIRGKFSEAMVAIDTALSLDPDNAVYMIVKADLLSKGGWTSQAIDLYRQALKKEQNVRAAQGLAELLLSENLQEDAMVLLEPYVARAPRNPRLHNLLGRAYTESQMFELADRHWKNANPAMTTHAGYMYDRVRSEISAGRFEVAEGLIREMLAKDPNLVQFYRPFTTIRKITADDMPLIESMEGFTSGELPNPARQDLSYALGKAYNDLGDYEKAMGWFDEANRIQYETSPLLQSFDKEVFSQFIDLYINYFTKERVEQLAAKGLKTARPLFVMGMVRSGTSLTEQILSCHPEIAEGGEKMFWSDHMGEVISLESPEFKQQIAHKLGKEYMELFAAQDQGTYAIDKAPANIFHAAALHCIFPNTKMVHVKRNAVDNLLSIWMTPFNAKATFVGKKENLVVAYKEYTRLYKHLQNVLPADRFRTFSYEDITAKPEPAIQSLLAYLGLKPDSKCLAPEKNKRTVRTPSHFQVRQPINTDSQERWKRYEAWLGPFSELLNS
jgi:tetratricopeptide (TPR) repeat protein